MMPVFVFISMLIPLILSAAPASSDGCVSDNECLAANETVLEIGDNDSLIYGRDAVHEDEFPDNGTKENQSEEGFSVLTVPVDEGNNNDNCNQAKSFGWHEVGSGSINPAGDTDWWTFTAGKSGTHGIFLNGISGTRNDFDLYVYSSCSETMLCNSAKGAGYNEYCTASFSQGTKYYVKVKGFSGSGGYTLSVNPECGNDKCCYDTYGFCYAHCGGSGEPECSTAGSSVSRCISRADTGSGNFICAGSCLYSTSCDDDPGRAGGLDCCGKCSSGPCCSFGTYSGTYKTKSEECGEVNENGCYAGSGQDSDVYSRSAKRYCSGSSTACNGVVGPWNSWYVITYCSSSQYCSGSTFTCCQYHSKYSCYDGDVYWHGSCGELQEKKTECGSSGYSEEYRCDDGNRFRERKYYGKGCSGDACFSTERWDRHSDCGTNSYGDWSDGQCIGGNVGNTRQVYYRGCSLGACFENVIPENKITKTCDNGCENGRCRSKPDLAIYPDDIIFEGVS